VIRQTIASASRNHASIRSRQSSPSRMPDSTLRSSSTVWPASVSQRSTRSATSVSALAWLMKTVATVLLTPGRRAR
jgi:hypothetical protein